MSRPLICFARYRTRQGCPPSCLMKLTLSLVHAPRNMKKYGGFSTQDIDGARWLADVWCGGGQLRPKNCQTSVQWQSLAWAIFPIQTSHDPSISKVSAEHPLNMYNRIVGDIMHQKEINYETA